MKPGKYVFALRSPRKARARALLLCSLLAAGVFATSATRAVDESSQEEGPVVRTVEGPETEAQFRAKYKCDFWDSL